MPLYFRSDTRQPSDIFKYGFSPRTDVDEIWWHEGIKARGYKDDRGINNESIDGDLIVAICLTTKFESAPIFPIDCNDDTYIYAIALPEATKIEYKKQGSPYVQLNRNINTPSDPRNLVIDLHSLQTTQTRNVFTFFQHLGVKEVKNIGPHAGWSLYAYEAIAYKITPENIICAIKVNREPPKANTRNEIAFPLINDKKRTSNTREFTINGDIFINNQFCVAHDLPVGICAEKRIITLDFTSERDDAVKQFSEAKNKTNHTPDIYYGLGGKTF